MRTVNEIIQANIHDLDHDEMRVREAFADLAEFSARYNDVLASGQRYGFQLSVSPEIIDAMKNFKPHFGRIENAIAIFEHQMK